MMTRTLGKVLFLAVLIASSFFASAEGPSSWANRDFEDDFDGLVKMSVTHIVDTAIFIRERLGEVDVFVVTGTFICGGVEDKVSAAFIVDGEHEGKQTMNVSQDNSALFFRDRDVPFWIGKLNEGKVLKMRFTDNCGERVTLEFDISGHTRFEG